MEVVMGALPSLLPKLGELLVGEYKMQKGVKAEIMFIQAELESMKGALEKISNTPLDQLDNQDKIWSKNVRELSYDIEDSVDAFMVRGKGSELQGFKSFIKRCYGLLTQFQVRRSIANEIRDIKRRVVEVCERRDRYEIKTAAIPDPVTLDPRLFLPWYAKATGLVGIDEARDQVIKILMEDSEVSKQQDVISIIGFGGLGKTTLANQVYEKLRGRFDCSAFVSVSQTPDVKNFFKTMLRQLAEEKYGSINGEIWDEVQLMRELREFLRQKRYLIVIDDLWDIMVWKIIKSALPDNQVGCKIITTTRILSVAQQAGYAYTMKPLSPQNSRKLLYQRIFSNEDEGNIDEPERCPDAELSEVSNRILTKCAGVPLAIITIGSLLAGKGRNKMDWYEVYNSIGTGMEHSLDAQNMRKILSYSYYDLPSHLKTCLLYLCMFPEDFVIEKDRLIWLWIAEGFIQREEQGKGLFVFGESYFNELINRSMIQPVDTFGIINHCRVHDMVLDLIRSLSSEENFVTVLSDMDHATSVRRLSLQNSKADHESRQVIGSMPRVRSVVAFQSSVAQIPALPSFKVLRVLDLQGCDLSEGYSLRYLGYLCQLRYLSVKYTQTDQLPEEVGSLQFLETLNVREADVSRLPSSVIQLKHLSCLSISLSVRVPNGIRNLRCLEDLSRLRIDDDSMDCIEELCLLPKLRVLCIFLFTDKCNDKLVECIPKLRKIQNLQITKVFGGQRDMGGLDAWVAPSHLRRLCIESAFWFSVLPAWINNPSHLVHLYDLSIAVRQLQQKDLDVVGRLPALCRLDLQVCHTDLGIVGRFIVGASSFPCLVHCYLQGFMGPVVFQQRAMPRLTTLHFEFHVREEITGSDGGLDLGLLNLPLLQQVYILFGPEGARKEAEVALRHATEIHPNRPYFHASYQYILPPAENC